MSDRRETLAHQIECVMEDWKQHGHRNRMEYANRIATLSRSDERAKLREGAEERVMEAMNYGEGFDKFLKGELTLKDVAAIAVAAIFEKEG